MENRFPSAHGLKTVAKYKYSIGIDLGTTNCAVSFVDLDANEARSEVFWVPQLDSVNSLVESKSLPSFLYLPYGHEEKALPGEALGRIEGWVVGEFARKQTSVSPGRVAHSAKSWLGHHLESPERRLLPWDSTEVKAEEAISPLEASSMLLAYLKSVWDVRFAKAGALFADQLITITVPASFDVAAQQATMEAAMRAGYPDTVRLLEEPQAAFYRWMEAGGAIDGDELETAPEIATVLVVDIGGGTSDFSFFRVLEGRGEQVFERVAVSEHILLGGDNMDLALAHAIESLLDKNQDEELSGEQWRHLIAQARGLKERCLSAASPSESEASERLSIAIPGTGSGLLAGTLVAEIETNRVRSMLIDGFFPDCPKAARPDAPQRGLQEWGLPYAPDFAVTRYLADFVRELGTIDAVLFNGGTLSSPALKQRLLGQLEAWQEGNAPKVLRNEETDLAVARGAAYSGALIVRQEKKIEAGSSRAIYLEIGASMEAGESRLVCVLPKGAAPGEVFVVELEGLRLMVNQLARFQAYQGINELEDKAGALMRFDERSFTQLPLLETNIKLAVNESAPDKSIRVRLESRLNELGLLEVGCVSVEAGVTGSWPLHFSLLGVGEKDEKGEGWTRADDDDDGVVVVTGPGVSEERIRKAESSLSDLLKGKPGRKGRLTASRLLKVLERELALPKHEWNLVLSRRLAAVLLENVSIRERSSERAEAWAYLTGYLMRPGFGDANDAQRIAFLWDRLGRQGRSSSKAVETQELILWRRLSGGLSQERQELIYDRELLSFDTKKGATAERIRLLGTLEKLTEMRKGALIDRFLEKALEAAKGDRYAAPYFAALGGLLSRSLFRAGPEYVVSPAWVERAWERLGKLDWKEDRLLEVKPLFMRSARVVEERRLNVSRSLSKKIIGKLKKSGVPESKLRPLLHFVPMTRAEQVSAYGEVLPVGLVME